MALPTKTISLSQVNTELGKSASSKISLNDAAVRALAGRIKSGSRISMSDLRGKSSKIVLTQEIKSKRLGFTTYVQSKDENIFTKPGGYPLSKLQLKATKHGAGYRAGFILFVYSSGAKADELKANLLNGKWSITMKLGNSSHVLNKSNINIMHTQGNGAIQVQAKDMMHFYLWLASTAGKGAISITIA